MVVRRKTVVTRFRYFPNSHQEEFLSDMAKKKTITFPSGNLLDIIRLRALKNFGTQNLCPTTKTKN